MSEKKEVLHDDEGGGNYEVDFFQMTS